MIDNPKTFFYREFHFKRGVGGKNLLRSAPLKMERLKKEENVDNRQLSEEEAVVIVSGPRLKPTTTIKKKLFFSIALGKFFFSPMKIGR